MDHINIFAPASVANVSCGFDVLGFCLDTIGDIMKVSKTKTKGISVGTLKGQKIPIDPLKNVACVAANALLNDFPTNGGFQIDIEKKIKPGSGIGSSAASAAGAVFAINELLGIDVDVMDLLPGDPTADGSFDNIASALPFTTAHMERYMSVARQVTRLATGLPPLAPSIAVYEIPLYMSQDWRQTENFVNSLPNGKRLIDAVAAHRPRREHERWPVIRRRKVVHHTIGRHAG